MGARFMRSKHGLRTILEPLAPRGATPHPPTSSVMVHDDHPSALTSGYDRRERLFVVGGVHWRVRLVDSFDRRRPDLLFESDSVIRRVRAYPEDWHSMSDDELLKLSWNR